MAKTVADHDASVVIMASRRVPGDLLTMDDILDVLAERVSSAVEAGVDRDKIVVDPGIGKWIPEKEPRARPGHPGRLSKAEGSGKACHGRTIKEVVHRSQAEPARTEQEAVRLPGRHCRSRLQRSPHRSHS